MLYLHIISCYTYYTYVTHSVYILYLYNIILHVHTPREDNYYWVADSITKGYFHIICNHLYNYLCDTSLYIQGHGIYSDSDF